MKELRLHDNKNFLSCFAAQFIIDSIMSSPMKLNFQRYKKRQKTFFIIISPLRIITKKSVY